MKMHVTPEEAIRLILEQPVVRHSETLPLAKALDRILAEDVFARIDLPSFNKSPFDGYAYRTGDVPGTLRVIGTLGRQSSLNRRKV